MVEAYLKNLGSTNEIEVIDEQELEESYYKMLTGEQAMM